jgi:hypothetical protein
MLVLLSKKSVKKFIFWLKVVSLALLITFAAVELYKLYHQYDFKNKTWLREDKPSGNPLKVQNRHFDFPREAVPSLSKESNFLEEFKVKMERYYRSIDSK